MSDRTTEFLGMEIPRLDRNVLTASRLEDEDREERDYWHRATPEQRLRHLELLRRLNYGDRARGRLQRVLTVDGRGS